MILHKISELRKDLKNLIEILSVIKVELSNAKEAVAIAGKTLRQANLEQSTQFGYYDEIRLHLQSLSNYLDIKISQRRAKALKIISENSSYDYGERMKEKIIDDDQEYIELKLKKLEVDEVLALAISISKQFEYRGYALNNITKVVVSQVQDEFMTLN